MSPDVAQEHRGVITAVRGAALSFRGDAFALPEGEALRYESDAIVAMQDGRIVAFGPASAVLPVLPSHTAIERLANALIVPGFIDAHAHYAQLGVIGACGHTLLDWLTHHTFPLEAKFADPELARATAELFLDECLRQGTTTAAVYGTVHAASADAFLEAARQRDMRMICGKVCMDRNAPAALLDTAQSAYDDGRALIERWHGRGRLAYAVTPRFAPTSTPEQLELAGALLRTREGLYLQTHLAETQDEVQWVRALHPGARDYLDVYDRHGLVGRRSVFGHGLYLDERAWQRLHESGAAIAHCPTSNAFLGSGHFRVGDAMRDARRVHVALASDVGGGTTMSMLATMAEAYKVARLGGCALTAAQAWWLATRGAAQALDLAGKVGALDAGHDADVVVLDLAATPLLAFRSAQCGSVGELLAVLMMLGDDRTVAQTWIGGRCVHVRDGKPAARAVDPVR